MIYHLRRVLAAERWKTSFGSQLGHFEGDVLPFGKGASSMLLLVMNPSNSSV